MGLFAKAKKYISFTSRGRRNHLPRILIFFVTSKCNQACGHCFYAAHLNQPDDLDFDQIEKLSRDLDRCENVLFSGGEPFVQKALPEIAGLFYRNNHTRHFTIPTNGTLLDRTIDGLSAIRENCPNATIDVNFSFDGLEETHNRIRQYRDAFERSMSNVEQILGRFEDDRRIRFQISTTVMNRNVHELSELTDYVHKRFDGRLGVSFGFLRGETKDKSLQLPAMDDLVALQRKASYRYRKEAWLSNFLYKAQLEAKLAFLEQKRQVFQCLAGDLLGVVYADGRVSSCEILPSFGSLKDHDSFRELWTSQQAERQKRSIRNRECVCTHECFITPSLMYHRFGPFLMLYYFLKAKWRLYAGAVSWPQARRRA
jgi:MoaA/NifB/PqqE/SkfB family radical SAM enzyme